MSFPPIKGPPEAVSTPDGKYVREGEGHNELANYGFSRAEVAAYLTQMVGELAAVARSQKLDSIAYFLEMARIEASIIERESRQD